MVTSFSSNLNPFNLSYYFRTIESLLTMAEVDIICDDHQQAASKLNGAEALLAGTGALSPLEEGESAYNAR